GQYIRGPEQDTLRDFREEMGQGDEDEHSGEDRRAALESESGIGGHEVAEGGAEGVRHEYGNPVETLAAARDDVLELDLSFREVPGDEDDHDQRGKRDRGRDIAELQRAIEKVGRRGSDRGGGDDDGPIRGRMVAAGTDLDGQRHDEERQEDERAACVAETEGHRQRVAAGLTDGRRADLDDPEPDRHQRNLAQAPVARLGHYGVPNSSSAICTGGISTLMRSGTFCGRSPARRSPSADTGTVATSIAFTSGRARSRSIEASEVKSGGRPPRERRPVSSDARSSSGIGAKAMTGIGSAPVVCTTRRPRAIIGFASEISAASLLP